jgi:dihydroorotate dehydrogenase electron transfer subunit
LHTGILEIVRISNIICEAKDIWTIRYEDSSRAEPGQFVMVWAPGIGEVPMSLSYSGRKKGFTFRTVGRTTSYLSSLGKGEKIGIRGIFGKPFRPCGERLLVVGGGTGIASVVTAAEEFSRNSSVDVVLGAKSADELFFCERMEKCADEFLVSTDDGSRGERGFATEVALKLIRRNRYDCLIACGPELMLHRLATIAEENGIKSQIAVERYMKCGFGICDACSIDGYLVCRDGPVFDGSLLLSTNDFGKYRLDPSGRKVKL